MVSSVTISFDKDILAQFLEDLKNFQRGSFRYFSKHWHKYTEKRFVSNGLKLDLKEPLFQNSKPFHPLLKNKNEINYIIKLLKVNKFKVLSKQRHNLTFNSFFLHVLNHAS